jgi:hypothetical protein
MLDQEDELGSAYLAVSACRMISWALRRGSTTTGGLLKQPDKQKTPSQGRRIMSPGYPRSRHLTAIIAL